MTELRTSSGRFTLAGLLLFALPLPLSAQVAGERQPAERTHVVRSGDTLWDLARAYLADPFLWPEIFRLNAALVQDPARIYPDQRLRLPGGAGGDRAAQGDRVVHADDTRRPGQRTVFYEGYQQQRRQVTPISTVRAAGTFDVPVVRPGDFFRSGVLAHPAEIAGIGQVTGRETPNTIRGALPPQIALYDRVLITVESAPGQLRLGDRVIFYRQERRLQPYGWVWRATGMATIADLRENAATAVVVELFDVVNIDDLVVPAPRFPVPAGVRPAEQGGLEGRLLGFERDITVAQIHETGFIDLGRASGLSEGDEFIAYIPERRNRQGETSPAVDVARLQVVRVMERTSAVRVSSIEHPRLETGMAVRLVARMP